MTKPTVPPTLDLRTHAGAGTLAFAGTWRLTERLPRLDAARRLIDKAPGIDRLAFDGSALDDWDTGLVTYIAGLEQVCRERDLQCDAAGLPEGLIKLLAMARTVPQTGTGAHKLDASPSFLARVGSDALDLIQSTGEIMEFFGEGVIALKRFLHGRARFRQSDLWVIVQEAGADALPIVGLVSFLVGMILGYIGDQQLAEFGAQIYVADLVGLATVIQMGALITAIVLAGRTGAAFAARIGTMQVNEEIDALRTLGISPMEFLVLPRMLALIAMTPLLAIYADLLGILGGAFVGTVVGGITLSAYLTQTQQAIGWNHIIQGLIAATVYGAIVAASGCLRGMQCGRSAAAVGDATTSAVVTAIVFIVIAAAVLTIIFDAIGLS
jgi:phospholipid/cholesterol/gamma-HCH transport system permease protein